MHLLNVDVLGFDSVKNEYIIKNSSKDPFLRSIAHWYLKNYNFVIVSINNSNTPVWYSFFKGAYIKNIN